MPRTGSLEELVLGSQALPSQQPAPGLGSRCVVGCVRVEGLGFSKTSGSQEMERFFYNTGTYPNTKQPRIA